jgi:hypothetical protein
MLLSESFIYLLSYPTIKNLIASIKRNNNALTNRFSEDQPDEAHGRNRLVQLE